MAPLKSCQKIMLSMDDVGYNEKVDVIVADVEVDDIVIVVDDGDIIVVDVIVADVDDIIIVADVNYVWDGSLMDSRRVVLSCSQM